MKSIEIFLLLVICCLCQSFAALPSFPIPDEPEGRNLIVRIFPHTFEEISKTNFLWVILLHPHRPQYLEHELSRLATAFDGSVQFGEHNCGSNAPQCADAGVVKDSPIIRLYNFSPKRPVITLPTSTYGKVFKMLEFILQNFPGESIPLLKTADDAIARIKKPISVARRLVFVQAPKNLQSLIPFRSVCHLFSFDVECVVVEVTDLAKLKGTKFAQAGYYLVSHSHVGQEGHEGKEAITHLGTPAKFFSIMSWMVSSGGVAISPGFSSFNGNTINPKFPEYDGKAMTEDEFRELEPKGKQEQQDWLREIKKHRQSQNQ
eukprot:PhF_6_TR31158/c0_g1_i2/m.45658